MKKEAKKIEEALKLVTEVPMSYKQAAKNVGLSEATVARWAKREGILSPHAKKLLATKLKKIDQAQIPHTEEVEEIKPAFWQRIKNIFRI